MRFAIRLSILLLYGATAAADDQVLEEVIVTATLREQSLLEAPASVTLLNEQTLRLVARQHFEDVLSVIPNLHWAGATSRPRFFQIRGVGEREQWQGAPNPSVGFLIDDIDFSGIGMPGTLFDVERVEVLRGPQGMRYGANALAGLIVLRGRAPADEFGFQTEASIGEYASESIGAVATGPVDALNSSWRVAVQRYRSDGYRRDVFLDRDDTNGYDELTGRTKWHWQAGENTSVDFTWLHTNLDNGYERLVHRQHATLARRSSGQRFAACEWRSFALADARRIGRDVHGYRDRVDRRWRIQLRRGLGKCRELGAVHVRLLLPRAERASQS